MFRVKQSLWNLAGVRLPTRLQKFRKFNRLWHWTLRLRYFAKFYDKASYRILNRDPERHIQIHHVRSLKMVESLNILSDKIFSQTLLGPSLIPVVFHSFAMSWWRHQMETFSAQLALCAGNSPVPVNSPHKGQCRGALMFSLICVWINGWVNNREAGGLRRHRGHFDVCVMSCLNPELPMI